MSRSSASCWIIWFFGSVLGSRTDKLHLVFNIALENRLPIHHRNHAIDADRLCCIRSRATGLTRRGQKRQPSIAAMQNQRSATRAIPIELSAVRSSERLPQAEEEVEVRRLAHMRIEVNDPTASNSMLTG